MAIRCFGFEGGMGDAMLGEGVFDLFRNLQPAGEVVEDDMCRECRFGGADGPHVDVVCLFYMLVFNNQLFNLLQFNTFGNTIHGKF